MFSYNPEELVLIMATLECYCGGRLWFWPKDNQAVIDTSCPVCGSTYAQIVNWEEDEKYIEWYKCQQI